MAKIDAGAVETDKVLVELEKKIAKEYRQANKEVQSKLNDYLRRFAVKDEKKRAMVASGEITKEEYQQWRIGQIAVGERWQTLRDGLAEEYHNANQLAMQTARSTMAEVYAINHNYGTYEAEVGAKINTGYTLYNRESVQRIMEDNPDMLPAPGKKVSERIAEGKDVLWNKRQIQSTMVQGILQGKSIPALAKYLADEVGDKDYRASIRNARTMTTGAQNAGRVDAYSRAKDKGVNVRQTWVATLDGRTRHSHRQMDGETVDVGETFSNGCRFPGDPHADPSEIYNCRCTLIGQIKGFERDVRGLRDDPDVGGMTYEEWKEARGKSQSITSQEDRGNAIKQTYTSEYRNGLKANNSNELSLIPEHEPPVYRTTVDFDDNNAVKSIIEEFEKEARSRDIETARIVTTSGKVYDCFGVENGVFPDADLGNEIVGAIISHNHPIEETMYTFSHSDADLFMTYKLKELRGVDEKYTYVLDNSKKVDEPLGDWMEIENCEHFAFIDYASTHNLGYRRFFNDK